jgi:hypothetical protein
MEKRRCAACHKHFHPRPQSPTQAFCSGAECQRERKRRWQRAKRGADPDYRENEARSSRDWRQQHASYWREYRRSHPDYTARNRKQQKRRNQTRRSGTTARANQVPLVASSAGIANGDASAGKSIPLSGTYQLIPVREAGIANEDAWTAEISLISEGYTEVGG